MENFADEVRVNGMSLFIRKFDKFSDIRTVFHAIVSGLTPFTNDIDIEQLHYGSQGIWQNTYNGERVYVFKVGYYIVSSISGWSTIVDVLPCKNGEYDWSFLDTRLTDTDDDAFSIGSIVHSSPIAA